MAAQDSNLNTEHFRHPEVLCGIAFRLNLQHAGAQPIPDPRSMCGPDPTPDELGCEAYDVCE